MYSLFYNSGGSMDSIDKKILKILRDNSRKPISTISEILGLSRITIQKRIDYMVSKDVIRNYTIKTGAGYESENFRSQVLLQVNCNVDDKFTSYLKSFEDITTAHSLTGRFDVILLIETSSSEKIDKILAKLRDHPNIERTESYIILSNKFDRRINY